VRLMGRIYERAERTVIWLGDMSINFGGLKTLIDQLNKPMETRQPFQREHLVDDFLDCGLPMPEHEKWIDLRTVLSSFWFSRKWIIQEVTVARTVSAICGSGEIDWRSYVMQCLLL
jgi:hypothetical protein